ncbi:16S rRNA (cytosine(967)-C(5))-methyltransferase RsmB [Clostridium perfringens]|uniref:16S rRNA (cytosine(967)-C(5))-methyltransferase n=1 Tax=Clostridium perfringens TaxID=1502 RepID=A0A133NEB8_CLOPF|nr:16S rRNA (cytosine(967)-C(5))-methyltransferase RsmB [Clostridium perfringens]EGT5617549.1 16S rRNA (cytosine(967)-C(5))-methyltransferase RsmB [Clostridium perfringens]EHK2440516.1 16S rRNA (cytosine(967)-C(5))-methyltransferase RsmB [Clostridium perfringens]KXA14642.1 ribosomal RNA small subunit methyltransferase B [Clostridium perfringens]MBS5921594.1 16S rRNA (cytosine(967)-C(5))-methyltransferase RsmB [Clostridium perfringens]MCH1963375.1 16S rRNA (cytosine(967)-C(5))-methyltransferase
MNARKIIVEILDNVLLNGAYSNIEINKQFASNNIDPKDKGLITEVVYGTIKYKKMIDIILSSFVADIGKIDESVVNILRSAIYQMKFLDRVPPYAIVNEAVNLTKETAPNLAKFVNGVLRNYLRNENKNFKVGLRNNEALCYDFSFDRWMIEMFIKQYGKEDALRILRGLNTVPYVTVRVNTCKADYDEVYERLEEEGYDIEEGAFSPEAIIIKKGSAIEKNKLYQEGLITVQDESAMLVAPLFDLKGDEQVMDLCSAPGTKATHIGELMMNKGKVVAFDIHDHKLALIKENIDRLGLTNVEVELGDATKINSKYINWADRILLDVPCSGLGIIRKKPEIKWNKKNNDLTEVVKVQKEILKNAWNYLREGGELVYSTCTLNKKENEEVIDWFVERNSDCEVEKVFLGKADNVVYNDNGSVTILPNKYMDGFFIAKLKKKESK